MLFWDSWKMITNFPVEQQEGFALICCFSKKWNHDKIQIKKVQIPTLMRNWSPMGNQCEIWNYRFKSWMKRYVNGTIVEELNEKVCQRNYRLKSWMKRYVNETIVWRVEWKGMSTKLSLEELNEKVCQISKLQNRRQWFLLTLQWEMTLSATFNKISIKCQHSLNNT